MGLLGRKRKVGSGKREGKERELEAQVGTVGGYVLPRYLPKVPSRVINLATCLISSRLSRIVGSRYLGVVGRYLRIQRGSLIAKAK